MPWYAGVPRIEVAHPLKRIQGRLQLAHTLGDPPSCLQVHILPDGLDLGPRLCRFQSLRYQHIEDGLIADLEEDVFRDPRAPPVGELKRRSNCGAHCRLRSLGAVERMD